MLLATLAPFTPIPARFLAPKGETAVKKRHRQIALILGLVLALLAVTIALGAGPKMVWWLFGSGGGTSQASGRSLISAIGQPVAGKTSNVYTLYSGFYLSEAPTGPAGGKINLPILVISRISGDPEGPGICTGASAFGALTGSLTSTDFAS